MKYYALIFFIAYALPMQAQQAGRAVPSALLGVGGGAQFSWHSGTVATSDGLYDCCTFSSGNGVGLALGLRGLFALSEDIRLRAGIGYEQHNAEFASVRLAYPILGSGNTIEYADLDEVLEVNLATMTIDAQVQYVLMDPGLYLCAGPALHLPLAKDWTHTETIAAPTDLRYIDGAKSHVLLDGEIPEAGSFLSLRVGAGALFPIAASLYANPEILYSFALSEMQAASAWSISGFQLTLGIYAGL